MKLRHLLAAACAFACIVPAHAQTFPTRPITIVVPYAPGATDRQARQIAELASQTLGQPIVVENRDGAGATIGANYVATSKPDGYTILFSTPAVITVAPLVSKPPYKYDDLVGLARASITPHFLAARADAPFKNVTELIAYAKANPGKVTFASPGSGTAVHLAAEAFADAAGIKLNHIPYRGTAPAVTAAVAGTVDLVLGAPGTIGPQVEGGKLRAIAQFGPTRSPTLPNVPTLKESGVDVALRAEFGFFLPKGVPSDVVAKLDAALAKAIQSDTFKEFAARALAVPAYLPGPEYQKSVDDERAVFVRVVPKLALDTK